jgi:hypothetical protein
MTLLPSDVYLTTVLLQSGRQRRTNRCDKPDHGYVVSASEGHGICNIGGGPWNDCIDITAPISLSVLENHSCHAAPDLVMQVLLIIVSGAGAVAANRRGQSIHIQYSVENHVGDR